MKLTENWREIEFDRIVDLYRSVNWSNYTDDTGSLKTALENSTSVIVALENEAVVGLARSVSDDVSIHYLQDILVHPDRQRKGIGRKLFDWTLDRYKHVRTHMLLTDDEEKQRQFYQSLGYKNTKDLEKVVLNAFVKMKDVELA